MSIRRYGWRSTYAGWVSPCGQWLSTLRKRYDRVALHTNGARVVGPNLQSIARQVRDLDAQR